MFNFVYAYLCVCIVLCNVQKFCYSTMVHAVFVTQPQNAGLTVKEIEQLIEELGLAVEWNFQSILLSSIYIYRYMASRVCKFLVYLFSRLLTTPLPGLRTRMLIICSFCCFHFYIQIHKHTHTAHGRKLLLEGGFICLFDYLSGNYRW